MSEAVDPFAFLRANTGGAGTDGTDSGGPAADGDLFAGSEPVAPPAPAAPAQDATPTPDAAQPQAAQPSSTPAIPGDVTTAALLDLDARVQAIERLCKQNGWQL